MSLKERMDMFREENRLKTFKKWPFADDASCSAQKMAEAGFYFTGSKSNPDAAQCFLCGKELDGWDSTDDPWSEHNRHSADCQFAAARLPEENQTLPQLFDIREKMLQEIARQQYTEGRQQILDEVKKLKVNLIRLMKSEKSL